MADTVNVWELIKSELPKFATDMGIPFLGDASRNSVTDPVKPAAAEQQSNEALLMAAPQIALAAYVAPAALSVISAFPKTAAVAATIATKDPTMLISNPALSLAASIPESEGAIRPGGRPDLNLTHETSASQLLNVLTGRKILTHPSIAISSNEAAPFAGGMQSEQATLLMNPTSHYFDPATAKANQLINRDAFVTRFKESPLPREVRLGSGDLRFTEPFNPIADPKRGLDYESLNDILYQNSPQQSLSIAGSPRFSSFAQYENSRYGAKTLDKENSLSYHGTEKAIDEIYPGLLKELRDRAVDRTKVSKSFVKVQSGKAAAGDNKAKIFMDIIGSTFSNYAELKGVGNIPISGKTVSAIMLSPNTDSDLLQSIISEANKLGIKAGTPEQLAPKLRQSMQDEADYLKNVIMGNAKPRKNMLEFIDNKGAWHDINGWYEDGKLSPSDLHSVLYDELVKSNKFAGQVASSLTTADANVAKQSTKGKP